MHAYDQDGAEPDDDQPEPVQVNELRVTHWRNGGGEIHGTFEDPLRFAMIATVIDAKSRPLTKDDHRSTPSRAADALAEVCGYVLDHGDNELLPDVAGERPRVALTLRLTDLQHTARAGLLDFASMTVAIIANRTGSSKVPWISPPPLRHWVTRSSLTCTGSGRSSSGSAPSWS